MRIRGQLDALSRELDKLTSSPVELQANFDKFGYSAKIKTHEHEIDELEDGALAAGIHLRKDGRPPGMRSTTIPIYKKPILRQ